MRGQRNTVAASERPPPNQGFAKGCQPRTRSLSHGRFCTLQIDLSALHHGSGDQSRPSGRRITAAGSPSVCLETTGLDLAACHGSGGSAVLRHRLVEGMGFWCGPRTLQVAAVYPSPERFLVVSRSGQGVIAPTNCSTFGEPRRSGLPDSHGKRGCLCATGRAAHKGV
ncbi:hypothetical protein VTJ83DRAFT_2379 [Remersonia thermophila]|uniref:Uncharacterized protein n=1 Tax=Remersonia thermophila TaxID=72144 RepID=A0ABR4DJ59_9PEZI